MPSNLRGSTLIFGVLLAKKIVITTATVSMFRVAPGVDIAIAASKTNNRVDRGGVTQLDLSLPIRGIGVAAAVAAVHASFPVGTKIVGNRKEAIQIVWQDGKGRYHITYRVQLATENPSGDWEAFVDANSGKILQIENRFADHPRASAPMERKTSLATFLATQKTSSRRNIASKKNEHT
jgi:Zn-dependent metalloprotease